MNIIAIDSLKMNKNLKFRANEPQAPQAPVESPVANPTATMRALEIQGQNNIAFQGLNSSVLAKNAKKLGIAAAALAAVMSSPSCTKYEYEYPPAQNITINNSYNVTVNINQMEAFMEYMKERDEQLFNLMNQWMEMWKQDQIDDKTFYEQMYNLMLQNTDNQKVIIDLLVQNGKSEEEAKQLIQDLIAEVKAGNMTAAQAYEKIMSLLGQINESIDAGINQLLNYLQKSDEKLFNILNDMKTQYENNEITEAEYHQKMYDMIVAHQRAIISILKQIGMSEAEANAYLKKILAQLDQISITLNDILAQLKTISADNAKYHEENMAAQNKANEFLNILIEQGKTNFAYIEKITSMLSDMRQNTALIVENGNKTIEYIKMYGDKLIEEIRLADKDDIKKQDLEKMLAFYGIKIEDAVNMSADQLEAALKTFMERYEKTSAENQAETAAKLDEIIKNTQTLINQMGSLFNEVKTHNQLSNKYWNATLETINKFAGDVSDMKEAQKLSNAYLDALNAKASLMIEKLEDLAIANPGLTQEQLEEALSKYGDKAYEQYTDFAISIGLDKLVDKGTAIEETLTQIKAILKQKPEYAAQLNEIIQLLAKIDWNTAQTNGTAEEIKKLLAEFKCNCDCGKDSSENEGILGDLDNIVNGN